jgi:hypothetical protein
MLFSMMHLDFFLQMNLHAIIMNGTDKTKHATTQIKIINNLLCDCAGSLVFKKNLS